MNILNTIIASKRIEVGQRKDNEPLSNLTQRPYFKEPCYSVRRALKAADSSGIIAEHKRKSPSLGWIRQDSDVAEVAQGYSMAGAAAMSVLTDEPFFGGTLSDLQRARRTVGIPLLRKDFVIDEYQLFEAKAYGADFILLIAECLRKEEIKFLAEAARNLGLEVLLEMHDDEGLDKLCDAITCVGINSRNLKTFEVSLDNAINLAAQIPDSFVKVAESGISKPETIGLLRGYGFEGFLIGEAFMKTEDPSAAIADFISKTKK